MVIVSVVRRNGPQNGITHGKIGSNFVYHRKNKLDIKERIKYALTAIID